MADERTPSNGEELDEEVDTEDGQEPEGEPISEDDARRIAGEEFEDRMSTAEHQQLLLSRQEPAKAPPWMGAVIGAILGAIVTSVLFMFGWVALMGEAKATAIEAKETNRLQAVEIQRLNAEKLDAADFQKWFDRNSTDHNEIKADQKEQKSEIKEASKKLDQILIRLR